MKKNSLLSLESSCVSDEMHTFWGAVEMHDVNIYWVVWSLQTVSVLKSSNSIGPMNRTEFKFHRIVEPERTEESLWSVPKVSFTGLGGLLKYNDKNTHGHQKSICWRIFLLLSKECLSYSCCFFIFNSFLYFFFKF